MTTTACSRTTRRAALGALLLLAGLQGLTGCAGSSGGGACASPEISSSASKVKPGGTVQVTGVYFVDGCQSELNAPLPPPLRQQPIEFTQGGRSTTLGRVDSEDGTIEVSVIVPKDAEPGPADLQVGRSNVIRLTIG